MLLSIKRHAISKEGSLAVLCTPCWPMVLIIKNYGQSRGTHRQFPQFRNFLQSFNNDKKKMFCIYTKSLLYLHVLVSRQPLVSHNETPDSIV